MIRSKFIKAFILGMCITVFSTTAIFAAGTGGGQSSADQGQKTDIMTIAGSPGSTEPSPALSEEILKKQSEIDLYLFEKHKDEIAEKGITVTHTSPTYNYVEIGITPYNEANAEFLYKTFGKDMVKVVEGQQAALMTANAGEETDIAVANLELDNKILSADDNKAELYTATDAVREKKDASGMNLALIITLVAASGVIVLGGTVFVIRRRNVAVK